MATLKVLGGRRVYLELEAKGAFLQRSMERVINQFGLHGTVNRVGSMLTLFLGLDRVINAEEARRCDRDRFTRLFHSMMSRGVYFPPSPFEAAFISLAHIRTDLEKMVKCFEDWACTEGNG